MSDYDPFEHLGIGPAAPESSPRRRDLRQSYAQEKSTGRSRRAARRHANEDRRARAAMKQEFGSRPAGRASGKPRKSLGKRIWGGVVSVIALALAAAFALATVGSPLLFQQASATASVTGSKAKAETTHGQVLTAAPGKEQPVERGAFQALSSTELYELEVGGLNYTVNNSGDIRWPFNSPVAINSPFGPRAAPCPGCSTFHRGTDFDTGDDAPIYAVAAGVVTASEDAGTYGQYVAISHDVNGMKFTSIYAHMNRGL